MPCYHLKRENNLLLLYMHSKYRDPGGVLPIGETQEAWENG